MFKNLPQGVTRAVGPNPIQLLGNLVDGRVKIRMSMTALEQFKIPTLIVGESKTFAGGLDWLRENGVEIIDLDSAECRELLEGFIAAHPAVWNEDIGEEGPVKD